MRHFEACICQVSKGIKDVYHMTGGMAEGLGRMAVYLEQVHGVHKERQSHLCEVRSASSHSIAAIQP